MTCTNLYYQHDSSIKMVARDVNLDTAWPIMLEEWRNTGHGKPPYVRYHGPEYDIELDLGSHRDFFYISTPEIIQKRRVRLCGKTLVEATCGYCGKKFLAISWNKKHQPKFCSRSCVSKNMVKVRQEKLSETKLICAECEKEFSPKSPTQITCCKSCYAKYRSRVLEEEQNGVFI